MADTRTNWAKTHDFLPAREAESLRHPATITELRQRVAAATAAGRHVHAVGSYWSFSDAPAGNDVSLGPARDEQTDPASSSAADSLKLAEIAKGTAYAGKLGGALTASVKQQQRSFVRLGGFVAVKEAIDALDAEDLALITMGSRSGQRVVGAFMTGTHGGDFDLAPIADTVRAIHLITHGGNDVWIEPASARITTDAGVKLLDGVAPGVRIEANDALFDAALVSVGSMGVIASVVLEARAMYGLSERVRWMPWLDVRAKLIDGTVFSDVAGLTDPTRPHPGGGHASAPLRSDGYRHLEIMINPYPDPQGVRWAFVATRVEHAQWSATDFARPDNKINEVALYLAVESGNPERYHEQLKELIGSTRADTPGAHRYLSVQDTKGRKSQPAYSSELCISTEGNAHVAAIDDMLSQIDRLRRDTPWEFSGFMSLRFTRASRGAIAMQSSSDPTDRFCHVEVFALQEIFWATVKPKELEGRNEDYVDALFDASERHGGRTHWGQWAHPEHPHTIAGFPRKQVFLDAKRALAGESPIASFDNAFSVRAGLVPTANWAFVGDGVVPTKGSRAPYDTKSLRERAPTALVSGTRVFVAAASGDGAPALSRHDGTRSLSFRPLELESSRYLDGSLVIAANHDARLELFARADDGRIFHAWAKKTPDQNLTSFDEFDGSERFVCSPAIVRDGASCLTMIAIDTNKRVLRRRQRNAGGNWHGWNATGSPFVSGACAAVWSGGIVVAARDALGKIVLGAQTSADQDAAFQWHTLNESADAEPTLVVSPQGLVVAYFQGGVLRAFAIAAASIRAAGTPSITPISSTTASAPRFVHAPGALITGSELVVAYPIANGKLAVHRHALSGGTWAAESVVDATLVSAVSLVPSANGVTAVGKIAHDLVVRRVIA